MLLPIIFIVIELRMTQMKKVLTIVCSVFLSFNLLAKSNTEQEQELAIVEQVPAACDYIIGQMRIQACFPTSIGNNLTLPSVQRSAYQQFYALNWPGTDNKVGFVDLNTELYESNDSFPVWQSWPTLQDFYVSEPSEPAQWFNPSSNIPKSCSALVTKNDGAKSALEQFIDANGDIPFGPKVQVLTLEKTAMNKVIKGQNGHRVKYQIYMNNIAYKNFVQQRAKFAKGEGEFSTGTYKISAKRGAIFIKAAWQVLKQKNTNIHRSIALVTDGGLNNCSLEVVGLVGMHIVHKSIPENISFVNKTNLWTWSTYQFNDNAPSIKQVNDNKTQGDWLFFNEGVLTEQNYKEHCAFNSEQDLLLQNYYKDKSGKCPINNPTTAVSNLVSNDLNDNEYTYVNRDAVADYFRKTDGEGSYPSVWKNYALSGVQWMQGYDIADNLGDKHSRLANVVLEPFIPESSCINCHSSKKNKAIRNDLLFLVNNTVSKQDWVSFNMMETK